MATKEAKEAKEPKPTTTPSGSGNPARTSGLAQSSGWRALIKTYAGTPNEPQRISQFIQKIEEVATVYGWDDGTTASAARLSLEGEAYQWLEAISSKLSLRPDGLNATDTNIWAGLNGLKRALNTRFHRKATVMERAKLISSLNQMRTESVDAFFDRVQTTQIQLSEDEIRQAGNCDNKMAQNGFAEATRQFMAHIIKSSFLGGLRSEIKREVEKRSDVDELITLHRAAKAVELALSSQVRTTFAVNCVEQQQEEEEEYDPREKDDNDADFEEVIHALRRQFKGKLRTTEKTERKLIRCYNCSKWGTHVARECRGPPRANGDHNNNNNNGFNNNKPQQFRKQSGKVFAIENEKLEQQWMNTLGAQALN